MRKPIEKYTALVMQPHVEVATDREGIKRNLQRALDLIDFGVGYYWEVPVRLVVFPEYFLQGVTTPGKGEHGLEDFMKKAITFDDPEMQALIDKCKEYNLYISGGGVIEKVPEFPDRWFNTAFILGPNGVELRYHKYHIPASIGLGTSPHDMWDEYSEVFGGDIKDIFPVLDSPIGKLGCMTCHDGCTPEASRALGFNGVEVICHPVALQEVEGVSEPWDFWMFTRRTRAHDNMAYVLGSNWGTVDYQYYPKAFCAGNSFAIDYTGMVLRHAPYPEEQVLSVTIDIEAQREHRTRINHNTWVDVRTEAFRQIYEEPIYPPNLFPSGNPPRNLAHKMTGAYTSMDKMYERGQLEMPFDKAGMKHSDLLKSRITRAQNVGALRKD
ncbi:nitrilase-related carbon-nitrogen hydrolase [Aliiroseovarius sp. 2305UL8-7]|uniref:nitrilase-related carbon-nitrogen hydrolase n=1 Tax=Aliiroseovarius conchicola TaxID=3121637 RepID=UPI003527EE64